MSFKATYLLAFLFLVVYIYQANAAAISEPPYLGRKCIVGKSFSDGCNTCFCGGNKQDEDGYWQPLMGCTLMMCYNPGGGPTYNLRIPPPDFYENPYAVGYTSTSTENPTTAEA